MIDYTNLVELVFKIVNFIAIIGLLAFIFKKYLLGTLRDQMHTKELVVEKLKKAFHTITRNYQLLDREIDHEQQQQRELKDKIVRWRADIDQQHEQLAQERNERSSKLKVQMLQQIKEIQKYVLYKQVLPQAVEQARSQLAKKFDDEQQQKEYLSELMRSLCSKRNA